MNEGQKKDINWGGYREGAGRKHSLPPGTKSRAIRCTEEEYEKIKIYLKKLRERAKTAVFRKDMTAFKLKNKISKI